MLKLSFHNRSLGLIEVSVHLIQLLQKLETDLESSLTGKILDQGGAICEGMESQVPG